MRLFIHRYRLVATTLAVTLATGIWAGARLDFRPSGDPADDFIARIARAPGGDDLPEPGHGDYFAVRLTYPTGRFHQSWLTAAKVDHERMATGVPAGQRFRRDTSSPSPLALTADGFTSLGPQPLNASGSHYGGRTNVIVTDPIATNVAYFGSDGGGVWKTTNCCSAVTTWAPMTDDPALSTIAIGDMVIDPNDNATIYAGTGDLRYGSWSFGSAGLLKSTDSGATWAMLGTTEFAPLYDPDLTFPQYQAIGQVEVDPLDSDNVIVGTKTGVFFSYDAGATWAGPCLTNAHTTQRQDVTGMVVREAGVDTEVIVAVGTRGFDTPVQPDLDQNGANGIYKTTIPVSGCPASWELLSRPDNGWPAGTGGGTPYPTNTLGRIDLDIAPSDPDVIYAQVASIPTRGQEGVWRTTDGGVTWEQRSDVNGLTGCAGDWPQNWYDQGVAVDPNDPDVVFISTVDSFRSTDGGTTFVNLTCGYQGGNVHVDHHARAYVGGSSSDLLIGSDGGVYFSANANAVNPNTVDFVQLNDSISTLEFYSGDITASFATSANPGINAGAQDNGSSTYVWSGTPGPAIWERRTGGDGMYARIEPVLEQRWYQESQWGNLKVSTTGSGGPFNGASGGWGSDRVSFAMPYELYKYGCPASGCELMLAASERVWETIQGAVPSTSWYVNSLDLTKGVLGGRSFINQLSHATTDPTIAIVGTNDGNVQYGFDLGQGVANSATWVDVTGGNAVLPNRPILDVATDSATPTVGYAAVGGFDENTPATPGHVYRVTCNANCSSFGWEDKSGNLPNIPINSILVNPLVSGQVFAGSDWGLYYTNDVEVASPEWQRFNAGLPPVMIWDMSIDRGFTTLALFTRSRGAYAWPLATGAIGEGIFVDGFESGDTGAWSATVP